MTRPGAAYRFSLRSSLIAGVLALTAAALLLVSITGAVVLRAFLVHQVDEQLTAGAAVAAQSPEALQATRQSDRRLRTYVSVTEYLIEVRDPSGRTYRFDSSSPLPRHPLLDQDAAADGRPRTVTSSGAEYRVISIAVGPDVVLIGMPLAPIRDAVTRLLLAAAVTSVTVLALLGLLGRLLVVRRLRPLDEIAAAATALADGDLERRVPVPTGPGAARTEVGRLTVAINGMLARIQGALAARARSESRMREFVADASHELRTPVTSIKGYLQLVRSGVVDLRARPDVLRRLEQESERMGALVTDLLYLARLDAGPAPRTTRVDLAALIRDAVADARAVEPDRPIGTDLPASRTVDGDPDALRQVLANLLGNVRSHTPPGTPAHVALTGSGGAVRVTVTDEGPGLNPHQARHAFDRFWRADGSRSATGGAGLGLAIVAEAVRAHGGTAGIEPGPGATVWFTIPAAGAFSSNSHTAHAGLANIGGGLDANVHAFGKGPSVATLLHRLGRTAYRHRIATTLVWLVLLIAAGAGALTLSGDTVSSFKIPGQESTTALNLIDERFGEAAGGASAQVVTGAPVDTARLGRLSKRLGTLPGVVSVTGPVVSPDKQAAYLTVTYGVRAAELSDAQRDRLADVAQQAGAEVTGEATRAGAPGTGHVGEVIGVVAALVVLTLTYGTLVAAGMNLLTAIVGVALGSLGITTLTGFVDLQSTTPILAVMLGLAVGIDYALFIFTRFRHELRDGHPVPEAIATAVATAGSAVVTAGITVMIALAGLAVAGIPFLTEMGLAAAGTVVVAVLVAITLVPAVLGFIGVRALPRRQRGGAAPADGRGFFRGWAAVVTRQRWTSLLAATVALATVALPVFVMRTSLNQPPVPGSTQERAAEVLDAHFGPGQSGPLLILVDGAGAAPRAAQVARQAAALPDVARVAPPRTNPDSSAALITVLPSSAPDSQATVDLVHALRDAVGGQAGPEVYVTGTTAVSVDVSQTLNDALPVYLVLVVGLALLLLVLVFRSVLVPVVGVLGFLLTIGAALGATTAVFQWGWLSGLVGGGATGPLMSLAPIIVVGILFGLAMDYQVFLVSRMHEAHAHGAVGKDAIVTGFRQAAPVVVAAASIMFAVFAGFVPQGEQTVKPIAFALATGIFFDAFVVRMVIMPAALALLGRAAWWLPAWLRWLPTMDVEGAALERKDHPEPELTTV
ncbi:hypothetical protein GCM10012284_55760 [Mangrovihabitans endophyticus]|uniref:histidine kinase n=1 Tax=Mangrovihabitans endophyticus TaxID=1751298 RepID=A0A8J3FR13_9ACTN|nr:MMPL family transporter [Mangrovihabitans endophyticus]GGL13847.1 hypothetical protein GCM10012284_55760 [Mangrovihabitans endophyticus]